MFFNINQLSRIHVVYSWFFQPPFLFNNTIDFWSTLFRQILLGECAKLLVCETFQVDSADSNPCCGTAGAMSWCGCGMPGADPVVGNRKKNGENGTHSERDVGI